MRILDFSSSVDIAVDGDDIISTFAVPDDQIPPRKWGNIFAEDGKLRMFGGQQEYFGMFYDNITIYDINYQRPTHVNKLFTYDIQSREWEVTSLGLGSKPPCCTNIAYDTKNKVGWVYGGEFNDDGYFVKNVQSDWISGSGEKEPLTSLVKYDVTPSKAAYVEIPKNPVGHVAFGSMTFIEGAGEEGVLILFGGQKSDTSMVRCQSAWVFRIDFQYEYPFSVRALSKNFFSSDTNEQSPRL